jgi:hypothetical protein
MTPTLTAGPYLWRLNGFGVALIRQPWPACPKISLGAGSLRQKRHSGRAAARDSHLRSGIMTGFDDNALYGIVAFWGAELTRGRKAFDRK